MNFWGEHDRRSQPENTGLSADKSDHRGGEETVQAKLVVENVSKVFITKRGHTEALEDISLVVQPAEFVCLVGRSGSGKSTLLNLIAGLEKPGRGRVLADGKPVSGPGADRMMMFQESALFPWLDVMGN